MMSRIDAPCRLEIGEQLAEISRKALASCTQTPLASLREEFIDNVPRFFRKKLIPSDFEQFPSPRPFVRAKAF